MRPPLHTFAQANKIHPPHRSQRIENGFLKPSRKPAQPTDSILKGSNIKTLRMTADTFSVSENQVSFPWNSTLKPESQQANLEGSKSLSLCGKNLTLRNQPFMLWKSKAQSLKGWRRSNFEGETYRNYSFAQNSFNLWKWQSLRLKNYPGKGPQTVLRCFLVEIVDAKSVSGSLHQKESCSTTSARCLCQDFCISSP